MRLTWYIIRLHIGPLIFGTSVVIFIFLLQLIFKNINALVGKGLDYWVIIQFIAYNIAWMLVLAVPMGVLVASLMAYGKLSGNNELTIIKSSGGSAFRAMLPSIIGGAILTVALFIFNDRILPETNHRAYVLQNDIAQLKPTLAIDPGRFSTLQGYSILAREVDRNTNELFNVTIYGQDGDFLNVINAKRAELRPNQDFSKMLLTLHQGEIHVVNRRTRAEYRKLSFLQHQVTINVSGFNFTRSDPKAVNRNDRTMNIDSMRSIVDTAMAKANVSDHRADSLLRASFFPSRHPESVRLEPGHKLSRQEAAGQALSQIIMIRPQFESELMNRNDSMKYSDQFLVEIYKKYSIPAACFVFIFVGAPLGIVVRRGNFGVSAAIALGFFVIYWSCLVAGEKLADRAILSPGVAMWMADGVIGLLGIYLTVLVSRETVSFTFDFPRLKRIFGRGKDRQPQPVVRG
jgi:lipopolysaccharide export system permease protein